MMRSASIKFKPIRRTLTKCGLALTLTLSSFALEAHANTPSPQTTLKIENLKTAGISPEQIRSAVFLKMPIETGHLKVSEGNDASPLSLSRVTFTSDHRPGVWLRAQCNSKSRTFFLEECRGSVCMATRPLEPNRRKPHERIFSGEFASYTLGYFNLAKQSLSGSIADGRLCNASWPAWAVSARARSKSTPLEFPSNLLLIQTPTHINLMNALHGNIWNAITWPEELGIFSHARVSQDGRLLLESQQGHALYLSFAEASYVAVRPGAVTSSAHGINALFSTSPGQYTSETQPELPLDLKFNLGGAWTSAGFFTWKDLHALVFSKNKPYLRPYPGSSRLISAVWSEHSGLEKSYVLVTKDGKLELLTSTDFGKTFAAVRTFGFSLDLSRSDRLFIHEEFITKISAEGEVHVNTSGEFFSENPIVEKAAIIQNGLELLGYQKLDEKFCRIALYLPRSSSGSWHQKVVLPKTTCTTGLGRSGSAASLVEITPNELKIYVAE